MAAVARAKDLPAARDAVDLVGIARMERHPHHRGLGLDPVIETLPALPEIRAAIERPIGALRSWAEAGV